MPSMHGTCDTVAYHIRIHPEKTCDLLAYWNGMGLVAMKKTFLDKTIGHWNKFAIVRDCWLN